MPRPRASSSAAHAACTAVHALRRAAEESPRGGTAAARRAVSAKAATDRKAEETARSSGA
ncbi:hypothetical protein ACFW5G_21315 [Streptomyces griseoaurantiacus]|uniref:hypothetical protein n=1 Tax=Streptomyces griseoaurantiacus TaxID=68213 RepID=UPI0036A6956B